ncbi:MAG: hypothetical protein ACTSUT_11125 [Promethearchaeota archaeon]
MYKIPIIKNTRLRYKISESDGNIKIETNGMKFAKHNIFVNLELIISLKDFEEIKYRNIVIDKTKRQFVILRKTSDNKKPSI